MNTRQLICSIIIPTRDRRSALLSCLDALAKQTRALDDVEVIVCDDGSSDGTAEAVEQWRGPFVPVLLRNESSHGMAAARNRALSESGGEYILYLSDDAVLSPHGLELHLSLHGRHSEKKIAVSGSYSLAPHQEQTLFGYVLNRSDALFPYPAMLPNTLYGYQVFYAYNVSIPRAAHNACGVFDEDFRSGGEDREFGCRLEANGYKALYAKNCSARAGRDYRLSDFIGIHRERGAAGILLHRKHPELPCDYEGITARDIALLDEALKAVEPAVQKIISLIGEIESVYSFQSDAMDKLLRQAPGSGGRVLFPRFAPDPRFHQRLWQRDRKEMRDYSGRIIQMLHFFRENKGDHMGQLLDGISSCGYFLQAYYNASGMIASQL